MNVVLIYNAKSGTAQTLSQLRKTFKKYGHRIVYSFTVDQIDSAKLKQLIERGSTIAVVGGDGTINCVVQLMVGSNSTLLPLPGGTFNHFVRDLGMPLKIEEVLAANFKTHMIDVGFVNDNVFVNNSSLGLYPFSVIERSSTRKFIGKWAAMITSAISVFAQFRRHRLIIDGNIIHSPFVFIGNNEYNIEKSLIPERSSFSKGVLTVMVATSNSRLALIRAGISVLRGDVSRHGDFSVSTRRSVTIYSHRKTIPVSLDGEVRRLNLPLEYQIKPKCLRVFVTSSS